MKTRRISILRLTHEFHTNAVPTNVGLMADMYTLMAQATNLDPRWKESPFNHIYLPEIEGQLQIIAERHFSDGGNYKVALPFGEPDPTGHLIRRKVCMDWDIFEADGRKTGHVAFGLQQRPHRSLMSEQYAPRQHTEHKTPFSDGVRGLAYTTSPTR